MDDHPEGPQAWIIYRPRHLGLTCEETKTLEHGRTRYTRGCRCAVCKAAKRDYQRDRYWRQRGLPVDSPDAPALNLVESQPIESHGCSVVAGVRAELDAAADYSTNSQSGEHTRLRERLNRVP